MREEDFGRCTSKNIFFIICIFFDESTVFEVFSCLNQKIGIRRLENFNIHSFSKLISYFITWRECRTWKKITMNLELIKG